MQQEIAATIDDRRTEKSTTRDPVAKQAAKLPIIAAEGEEVEYAFETLAGYVAPASNNLKVDDTAFIAKGKPDF